jgi:hypothetical protein
VHGLDIFQKGAFDTLFDPPGRICAKTYASVRIEVIDRPDEADIALFDQIAETHPPVTVLFSDVDDEPQITAHQLLSSPLIVLFGDPPAQLLFLFHGQQ